MRNQTRFRHPTLYRTGKTFDGIWRRFPIFIFFVFSCVLPVALFSQPLAKDQDKFLGCSTSSSIYRNLVEYWNQITPGNDGKWGSVELVQGQYLWTDLNKIYYFAKSRNLLFKEHTLIWGNQQPYWIASLDSSGQRAAIEKWIRAVGENFPLMSFADVVNEPFNAPPVYKKALGGDGITGWDWVVTAFQLARQYCSSTVKLLLNEYNILQDDSRTTNYINLATLLKNRGLIDGIGVQGHYFEFRSHTDATSNIYVYNINTLKANLDRLAAVGLPIYISEFDIDESNDANQLAQYKIYFPIFWEHPAVKGVTLWGYIQNDVWTSHPYTYLLLSNGTERPALQWLRTYILSPRIPAVISPDAVGNLPRNPILTWHTSASATSYRVQVAASSLFTSAIVDTAVTDTLLQLKPLDAKSRFFWHVSATNEHGTSEYSGAASFMTGEGITSVAEHSGAPGGFKLFQNYPNPFNPTTTIDYSIAVECLVQLKIYDLLGREIKTLVNSKMHAGTHTVHFIADDLNSGIYFYRIQAADFEIMKPMMLIK